MKSIYTVLLMLLMCNYLIAQEIQKDKGKYIHYYNKFYNHIQESMDGSQKDDTEKKGPLVFKMDCTGKNIPQSIDEFTTVWCNEPISQGKSGTCWCFATSSFYESEIFRLTKQKIKLSELYIVYWEYVEKAREHIRTKGKSFFSEGSETNAIARMMKKYGIVPQEAYAGIKEGQAFHNHDAMFNDMKQYLKSIKQADTWDEKKALAKIKSILNEYIGKPPAKFKWEGKSTTPFKFMNDVIKINPDDYVNFMSLMEKPYYEKAEYKVPDNWWRSDDYNNVPLDDFMEALKEAIRNGYSISLGGDVSESGINPYDDIAMVPSYDIPSEYIDENARQMRFINKSTTDDHAIHVIGYLDKDDEFWFLIKDSGSSSRNGKQKGYYFYHEDYVKLKMMTFTIHKDAVDDVLKKMKIN